MPLRLIFGPMKSGKSLELVKAFSPLQYSNKRWILLQADLHGRDDKVRSRAGVSLVTRKVNCLRASELSHYEVVGIDEVHMFTPTDIAELSSLLRQGVSIVVSGLDLDYRGKLMESSRLLMELGPDRVDYLIAACDTCKQHAAQFSQVLHQGKPITSGLPSVLPEDGTYTYEARCRQCFVQ